MELITDIKAHPFLRWTGSKRWLVKDEIKNFLPQQINNYYEPFLGGGAVFFFLKSEKKNNVKKFTLSDANEELINTYIQLRDNPQQVINELYKYENTDIAYYNARLNCPTMLHEKAARFIYLNRTSFNGIYRVNSNGLYNVPYGKRLNVDIVTSNLLIAVSEVLKDVELSSNDFEFYTDKIQKNDLFFLDPPYTVAHENNGFIMYNQKLFSWDDQIRLRDFIVKISNAGAYYILTNAYHSSIVELYTDIGNMTKISRYSQIGGRKSSRGNYHEIIISNL